MSVKESKDVIIALVKLYKEVALLAKDGLQPKDAFDLVVAIVTKAALRDALLAAFNGSTSIPGEWNEVNFADIAEVVQTIISELNKE